MTDAELAREAAADAALAAFTARQRSAEERLMHTADQARRLLAAMAALPDDDVFADAGRPGVAEIRLDYALAVAQIVAGARRLAQECVANDESGRT